jgi:hypothetical protein
LLVATEEAGAQARGQIRPVTSRANEAVQPALGQMRIGSVAQHRETLCSSSQALYVAESRGVTPVFIGEAEIVR